MKAEKCKGGKCKGKTMKEEKVKEKRKHFDIGVTLALNIRLD